MDTLGIDVSKLDFHAVLVHEEHTAQKSFPNSKKGFAQLDAWLRNRGAEKIFACMEATGAYWRALATHLHEAGHTVAVVNPRRIKSYAESELLRNKTDAVDAALIARFAIAQRPEVWKPWPAEIIELQGLSRHLEFLKRSRTQHEIRAQTPGLPEWVVSSSEELIAHLDTQISELEKAIRDHIDRHPGLKNKRDLLTSIPGIANTTASAILAEMPTIEQFASSQAVAAYAGLSPQLRQSGTSVRGKPHLCKTGNARVRKALYFPAIVAQQYNPTLKAVAQRMRAAGKSPMVIIGALMRKLLILAYGVLRSGKPYDADFKPRSA